MTCALFKGYALKVEKSIILLSPKGKYLAVFFFPLRGTVPLTMLYTEYARKIAYTKRTYGGTPMSALC